MDTQDTVVSPRETGIALRLERVSAGLNQGDVCAAARLKRWRLSEIERGVGHPPSAREIAAVRAAIAALEPLERQRALIMAGHLSP